MLRVNAVLFTICQFKRPIGSQPGVDYFQPVFRALLDL